MEYEDTRTSGHEKPFYERLQKLYVTAVAMNLLQLTDALDEVDAGDSRGLQRYFGEVSNWEIPEIEDIQRRMVIVKHGRLFKNQLKSEVFIGLRLVILGKKKSLLKLLQSKKYRFF